MSETFLLHGFKRVRFDAPPLTPGGSPSAPPGGASPPRDPQAEALRAGFELDSAYREMRRAELMLQQMESFAPQAPETADAKQVLDLASALHRKAYQAYSAGQYLRAAEYAVAVKDLMRAIDKFYNVAITS